MNYHHIVDRSPKAYIGYLAMLGKNQRAMGPKEWLRTLKYRFSKQAFAEAMKAYKALARSSSKRPKVEYGRLSKRSTRRPAPLWQRDPDTARNPPPYEDDQEMTQVAPRVAPRPLAGQRRRVMPIPDEDSFDGWPELVNDAGEDEDYDEIVGASDVEHHDKRARTDFDSSEEL